MRVAYQAKVVVAPAFGSPCHRAAKANWIA
jgi:hypothetical protein